MTDFERNYKESKIREGKDRATRTNKLHTTKVAGQTYTYWNDTFMKGTYAENEDGEIRRIHGNGYLTKDLTARKAIAGAYRLETFRA